MIETYGYAGAGLPGNPSDGYYGKTLSFAMSNCRARVLLYPRGAPGDQAFQGESPSSRTSTTYIELPDGVAITAVFGSSRY